MILTNSKRYKEKYKPPASVKDTLPPAAVFQLLIHGCYLDKRVEDAINLYFEIASKNASPLSDLEKVVNIDKFNHERMINYLLKTIALSNKITNLLILKILWENYIFINTKTSSSELLYFAAYLNILLNTGQVEMALEMFKKSVNVLKARERDSDNLLNNFPTIRLLDLLASDNNCEEIYNILCLVNSVDTLEPSKWFSYLSTGLRMNHYNLVKLIYYNVIMKGYQEGLITTENALFDAADPTMAESGSKNVILNSITDELIMQILHTFSLNGDVSLSLTLIESHYIHKAMKGERALTKELCVCIIEAYCYNPDLKDEWDDSTTKLLNPEIDHSVERVLDVLDGFMKKLEREGKELISYKDICDCMSFKFRNYKVFDINVNELKRLTEAKNIERLKVSNENLESSLQGNVLANLDILTTFVIRHIEYLQYIQSSQLTISLFINCVLNHANLYQNLSGIIRILTNLHKLNSNMMSEWLDNDLINIILNSASKSSAAKLISFELYKFLLSSGEKISRKQYNSLVSSILRDDIHECLQFYLYHYLQDHGVIDRIMFELLKDIPYAAINMNEKTKAMLSMVKARKELTQDEVENYWIQNDLCKDIPLHISGKHVPELNRKYYKQIDLRDVKYLKYILAN